MCGFSGFSNFGYQRQQSRQILQQMCQTLTFRGHDDHGEYQHGDTYFGHQRLSIRDLAHGHQPMQYRYRGQTYTIVYNGEIYNAPAMKQKLKRAHVRLRTTGDTELVLKSFALFGPACLHDFQGIFALAIHESRTNRIFLARDPLGVKPLFYYHEKGHFAFASEIKALLAHPDITPTVNLDGLRELFGIAPARTPGKTVYATIQEIPPATYAWWHQGQLTLQTYFHLQSRPHPDDAATTMQKLRQKITNVVQSQMVSDVQVGMFLSGGLDSSLITALAASQSPKQLPTFAVDYANNDTNFVATDFTPTRDNYYIDLVSQQYQTRHQYHVLHAAALFNSLHEALVARDYPAMADIDSSLLLFCRAVKRDVTVCLSGEFADEIFCGYPWFYRTDTANVQTFPWSIDITMREQTVAKALRQRLNLPDYLDRAYRAAIAQVPLGPHDDPIARRMKTYSYLTMTWFGLNLLERTDRMAMRSGLEVRVPFTDLDLVQYVYNIPWSMKNYGGQEKGILRQAVTDILPEAIINRKKCPYPKTVDPIYTSLVTDKIRTLIADRTHPVWQIVDIDYVTQVLNTPDNQTRPWFGQLMNRPQYLAFIIQIAMWLTDYQIILDLGPTVG